jgi:hypothetical protein
MSDQKKIASYYAYKRLFAFFRKWGVLFTTALLLLMLIHEVKQTLILHSDLERKKNENIILSQSLTVYQKNTLLTDEDKDYFGAIFAKQIPVHEDIFALYTFIDELTNRTNLHVISHDKVTKKTKGDESDHFLTISVSGVMTEDEFAQFMSEYMFGYSRFMTIINLSKTYAKDSSGTEQIEISATIALYTVPSVANIGQNLSDLKLVSFDSDLKELFDTIKIQISDANYSHGSIDEIDLQPSSGLDDDRPANAEEYEIKRRLF